MDLQEQRITCLRMAIEMGSKADTVVGLASEFMNFVMQGTVTLPVKACSEEKSAEVIAACGTALPASDAVALVVDQPAAAAVDAGAQTQAGEVTAVTAVPAEPLPEARAASPSAHAEAAAAAVATLAAGDAPAPVAIVGSVEVPATEATHVEAGTVSAASEVPLASPLAAQAIAPEGAAAAAVEVAGLEPAPAA